MLAGKNLVERRDGECSGGDIQKNKSEGNSLIEDEVPKVGGWEEAKADDEKHIAATLEMLKGFWGRSAKEPDGSTIEKSQTVDELNRAFVQQIMRTCQEYEERKTALMYYVSANEKGIGRKYMWNARARGTLRRGM